MSIKRVSSNLPQDLLCAFWASEGECYGHIGYGSSDIGNVEIFVSESLWKFLRGQC